MRLPLLVLSLALAPSVLAQPTFLHTFGGTNSDSVEGVAVDAEDNLYVVGYFIETVDFDPSDGSDSEDTFTSVSSDARDVFVASYTASGAFRWAFGIGANSTEAGVRIATDGGRVYVVGEFYAADMDVDPGEGETVLPGNGGVDGRDAFVVAYTAATGAFEWGFKLSDEGETDTKVWDVATDGSRVYLSGAFGEPLDLDPGTGVTRVQGFETIRNGFVAAYTAETGGFEWGHGFAGANTSQVSSIVTRGSSIYVTGKFTGTADFDPGVGTRELTASSELGSGVSRDDMFIAAYDKGSGAHRWSEMISGPASQEGVAIDADGTQIYVGGSLEGSADFDPGSGTAQLTASSVGLKPFVASFSAATGAYVWAYLLDSADSNAEFTRDVVVVDDRVYATGQVDGTVDFDPGDGEMNLTSVGGLDAFVVAYATADGALREAGLISGVGFEFGAALSATSDDVIVAGRFTSSIVSPVDFDMGAGVETRFSAGSIDAFIASYPLAGSVDAEDAPARSVSLSAFPNPGTHATIELVVDAPTFVSLTLYDALGRQLEVLFQGDVSGSMDARLPAELASGVYVVRVSGDGVSETLRVTVVR